MKPYEQGNNLVKFVEKMSTEELKKLFSDITFSIPPENRFLRLFDCGWVNSDVSEDTLRRLLNQYGEIKDVRNHTNHARNDHKMATLEDIKNLLTEYVGNIKDVCYRQRADVSTAK